MSLLKEIQEAAVDSKVNISTLLRKCKILASQLGNSDFESWVDNELNGYKKVKDLPDYRVLTVNSKGHFAGPFGSGLRNANIPLSCFPKKFHESLSHSYLMDSVSAIESLIVRGNEDNFSEPWDPDFIAQFCNKMYENMSCMGAWKVIPYQSIAAIPDALRNRILSFVMEIKKEVTEADTTNIDSKSIATEKVTQIFNT